MPRAIPFEVESDIRECVLMSAQVHHKQISAGGLINSGIFDMMLDLPERCNEICRMHRMCLDGLRWNAESGVFGTKEGLPV